MAVTPGQQPDAGTLNSKSTKTSGTSSAQDPARYPPGSFFGITVPTGTGAPGSAGAGMGGGSDPTLEAGQTEGSFGTSGRAITNTGAPGSAGAPANPSDSGQPISYTKAGSYLTGTYQQDTTRDETDGPRDSTQANDVGYGTSGPQLPALRDNQPTSTGAGRGRVMRGGRMNGG